MLEEAGDWLKAFQDTDFLFVRLQDSSNFFQLPIEVTATETITGGTALTLDVYSSNQYKRLVNDGLRAITADGADLGAAMEVGDEDERHASAAVGYRERNALDRLIW